MDHSITTYSKLLEHPEFRIDAECYSDYHLGVERTIDNRGFRFVDDFASSVINFGAYSLCNYIKFLDKGKPFIVTENIYNNIIDTEHLLYVSEDVHTLLYKSHCKKGQVLLTMAGAYLGQAAVYNESYTSSSNQAIAKIALLPATVNPYYLSTYLNCKFGQSQIERFSTGGGQPNLNLGLIKRIKVVNLAASFQDMIEDVVNHALTLRKESISLYKKGEMRLMSELGLSSWRPSTAPSFVKSLSEVKPFGRIDAEYFDDRFFPIISAIYQYARGWDKLGRLVSLTKGIEVGRRAYRRKGVRFVRVSNLTPYEITKGVCISRDLYEELKQYQPQDGEILLSKDATPGIAHHLNTTTQDMIISSGILRLKLLTDKIKIEVLTLLLNSPLVREQMRREIAGSVIVHWLPDQIVDTMIPNIGKELQYEIQELVVESRRLQSQSDRLLGSAKSAVEMAIEKDEDAAVKCLSMVAHRDG